MKYLRDEAVRYLGAKRGDRGAEQLTDIAYLKLRNEISPRKLYRIFDCCVDDGGVSLAGEYFASERLAKHLAGCEKAVLLAVTLGSKTDVALRALTLKSIAEGAAGQAVCAALTESLCDEAEAEIVAEACDYLLRPRFSPGYGDWSLADQPKLLRLLEAEKRIGLTLTAGGQLAPLKSVTAIIGLSVRQTAGDASVNATPVQEKLSLTREPETGIIDKCAECDKTDCEFRKGRVDAI